MSQSFEDFLRKSLNRLTPTHPIRGMLDYILFPTGKLFRAHLCLDVAKDSGGIQQDHYHFASMIELHHAYTLVHDDLPAMDNDDERRGRPSAHKQFNEWKALLAGDALLIHSFECLSKISSQKLAWLLKFACWCTASKGLILGQYMDLNQECNNSFSQLLKMHKLKTARLIQLTIVGAFYLNNTMPLSTFKKLMKLGEAIGINFQLIDDIKDLEDTNNQHERDINPFYRYEEKILFEMIRENTQSIISICHEVELPSVKKTYTRYLDKAYAHILASQITNKERFTPLFKSEYLG